MPQELATQDLQNINATDPNVEDSITKVLENLQSLRLNIANEHKGDGEYDIDVVENDVEVFPIQLGRQSYTNARLSSTRSLIAFLRNCRRSG